MKMNIIVNLEFEAIHCWKGAIRFSKIKFLASQHRHLFYIEAKKLVTHSDRQIETITLKRKIEKYLNKEFPNKNIGRMSCEMLAEKLLKHFNLVYCKVLEDNENGAEVFL